MYVVCVTVIVKPGMGDQYVEIARKNHEGSVREPGCHRFDVLRQATPPEDGESELVFLYEVYDDEAAFAAHQQTEHYFAFRDAAVELELERRKAVRYRSVFPEPWTK